MKSNNFVLFFLYKVLYFAMLGNLIVLEVRLASIHALMIDWHWIYYSIFDFWWGFTPCLQLNLCMSRPMFGNVYTLYTCTCNACIRATVQCGLFTVSDMQQSCSLVKLLQNFSSQPINNVFSKDGSLYLIVKSAERK